MLFCGTAGFRHNGYHYWFSVIDSCYYKERCGTFEKEEISKAEYEAADEAKWESIK